MSPPLENAIILTQCNQNLEGRRAYALTSLLGQ